jgi:ATP-dependent Clp protease protease subunit
MADHTGVDIERIQVDTERDNFMTAEEAREYGLIDKIMVSRSDESEKDKK